MTTMTLTPLEIKNKKFKKKLKGYNKDEVDDFLDGLVDDYEALISKNRDLEKELKHADEKLEYFNELKESLNKSIIVAQEAADNVKNNANKEAETIISSANQQAEELLSTAKEQARDSIVEAEEKIKSLVEEGVMKAMTIANETEDLTKKTRIFHQNLKILMAAQMELVNSSQWDGLLTPFSNIDENKNHIQELLDKEKEDGVNSNQDGKPSEKKKS